MAISQQLLQQNKSKGRITWCFTNWVGYKCFNANLLKIFYLHKCYFHNYIICINNRLSLVPENKNPSPPAQIGVTVLICAIY